MSNTLEFDWVSQNDQYQTGIGSVRTPEGTVGFSVKKPFDLQDMHPIGVAPGFSDGIVGTDRLANGFAEHGRVAFTLTHSRADSELYKDDPEGHKASNLDYALRAMNDVCPNLGSVDLAAQSEGAAYSTRFTLEHPGVVRTITAIGAGGLIEGDNILRLYGRLASNLPAHARTLGHFIGHLSMDFKIFRGSAEYVAENPPKAAEEALAIACVDIRPRFPELRKKGVKSAALQFEGDEFFPLRLVTVSTYAGRLFDLFTVYPHDRKAGHMTPQQHPRRVGMLVLHGIDKMTGDKRI